MTEIISHKLMSRGRTLGKAEDIVAIVRCGVSWALARICGDAGKPCFRGNHASAAE